MNFIEEFIKGQSGGNRGLYLGDGLSHIDRVLNGLQRGRIIGVASSPKVGKSTFTDYGFVINPYLHALKSNLEISFIYFSFELDRISKEFDFASYFLYKDYGVREVTLPDSVRKNGSHTLPISPDYLRGRIQDDEGNTILIDPKILECLKKVYSSRIIPLFGEYSKEGYQVKPGLITFVENRNNPTGLYKYLVEYASKEGIFIRDKDQYNGRIGGYKPLNPQKYVIIVTDHLRKLIPERGYTLKQTMDKYIEYTVELRNLCGFTFVHIVHLNRSLTDVQRLKQFDDQLYPQSDDVKDTGNLAEEADYMLTIFNPNDQKYNLKKFFGHRIRRDNGDEIYPNLRSIHLVESRHCMYPRHFVVSMYGGTKHFELCELNRKE